MNQDMGQSPVMENEVDPKQAIVRILRVCKNGRWLIGLGTLVAVAGTTAALAFVPSKYRSDATISVEEQEISSTLVTPLSNVPVSQKLQAMTREILSRSRLLMIVTDFDL